MTARPKTQFWGEDEDDDRLIRQILRGEKTATCCPSEYFGVGDLVDVYDLRERLRCIIRVTDIYEATLGEPPERLWRGECNDSAAEFISEHLACWRDLQATEATPITVTHFILQEALTPADAAPPSGD